MPAQSRGELRSRTSSADVGPHSLATCARRVHSFDESSVTHLQAAAVARKELCEHKVQTEKNHRLGNHLEAAIPQPVRESKHRQRDQAPRLTRKI